MDRMLLDASAAADTRTIYLALLETNNNATVRLGECALHHRAGAYRRRPTHYYMCCDISMVAPSTANSSLMVAAYNVRIGGKRYIMVSLNGFLFLSLPFWVQHEP